HAAHRRHYVHVKRSYDVMFFAVLIALVLFMTGFLQYKPVAILSDSMQPVYGRGSMVIVQTVTDPMDISIGDIIQYTTTDKVITHRVQEIKPASDGSGDRTFVTKGDNNSSADPPIKASQATGIIKAQVPYIGYPTIWLRALTR
ncbi:signal peptidase I, partial [Candidatus Saccharibacteria bacterium 32-45-3]